MAPIGWPPGTGTGRGDGCIGQVIGPVAVVVGPILADAGGVTATVVRTGLVEHRQVTTGPVVCLRAGRGFQVGFQVEAGRVVCRRAGRGFQVGFQVEAGRGVCRRAGRGFQVGFQVEAGRVVCLRAGRGFQVDEGVVLGLVGIVLSMPVAWRIPTIAGCDMGGANGLARQPCIQPIGTERTGALGIGVQCTAGLRIEGRGKVSARGHLSEREESNVDPIPSGSVSPWFVTNEAPRPSSSVKSSRVGPRGI